MESAYSMIFIEIECTKVNLKSANFAPQGGHPECRLPRHCQPQGWHLEPHLGSAMPLATISVHNRDE